VVVKSQAAEEKKVTGETCLDFRPLEIRSLRVRLQGTLFTMVNDPFTWENGSK